MSLRLKNKKENKKSLEMKHLNKEKEKKTKVNFVSSGERKFKYLKGSITNKVESISYINQDCKKFD